METISLGLSLVAAGMLLLPGLAWGLAIDIKRRNTSELSVLRWVRSSVALLPLTFACLGVANAFRSVVWVGSLSGTSELASIIFLPLLFWFMFFVPPFLLSLYFQGQSGQRAKQELYARCFKSESFITLAVSAEPIVGKAPVSKSHGMKGGSRR